MTMTTVECSPMDVCGVRAVGGVAGAKVAFQTLEARLGSLKGRRFYGVYDPQREDYRACMLKRKGDDCAALDLEWWTIPGGLYARTTLTDWSEHPAEIGSSFAAMAAAYPVDPARPSIEFYRSLKELVLFLPILEPSQRQSRQQSGASDE